jgi:hypothetical protein
LPALLVATGCGDPLNRQAVSGTVTYKGKPIVAGSVAFVPIPETGPTSSGAPIKDGKFEIPESQGLSPGKYRVRFAGTDKEVNAPAIPGSGPTPQPPKEILPPKHTHQSTHEVEVKSGEPNTFDFNLD